MGEFDGRVVIVIGATGALGAGLARAFRDAGAQVRGLDRSAPGEPLDGVSYQAVDVLDDAALGAAFDAGEAPWAVVNTVGGFAPHRPIPELDGAELLTQLNLNLVSAALVTKHALRRMAAAGRGRVVHTASRAALETDGVGFAYSVSKLGVLHLVRMAAAETRGTGITVNAVVPSIMNTPGNRAAMPDAPHAEWPTVAQVAQTYLHLASPSAQLTSGAAIPVYGRS